MRFMMLMIPKGYESAAPEIMPDAEAVKPMMKYNMELQDAGVLIAVEALHPPSAGARVSFEKKEPKVIHGPFPSVKEVLGGFWIIDVKSLDEAVEWAKRCPGSGNELIEIRRLQEFEEFPADVQEVVAGFNEMQMHAKAGHHA